MSLAIPIGEYMMGIHGKEPYDRYKHINANWLKFIEKVWSWIECNIIYERLTFMLLVMSDKDNNFILIPVKLKQNFKRNKHTWE